MSCMQEYLIIYHRSMFVNQKKENKLECEDRILASVSLNYMREVYQAISALSANFRVTELDAMLLFSAHLGHFLRPT